MSYALKDLIVSVLLYSILITRKISVKLIFYYHNYNQIQ